jgi:ATP-dependent helicase/nuclease subunit A
VVQRLAPHVLLSGRSYTDWIIERLGFESAFNRLHESIAGNKLAENEISFDGIPLNVKLINSEMLIIKEIEQSVTMDDIKNDFLQITRVINENGVEGEGSTDLNSFIRRSQINYEEMFSWEDSIKKQHDYIPAKVSVSQIKHMSMEESEALRLYDDDHENNDSINNEKDEAKEKRTKYNARNEEPVPVFIKKSRGIDITSAPLIGSLRGSAYHRFFELLDYSKACDIEGIKKQIDTFKREGYLDEAQAGCLKPEDYVIFCGTDIGRRMREAMLRGMLMREQPFCIAMPARKVNEGFDSEEPILVQGIIDALFIEEEKYVIVDYKTDRVDTPERLKELYKPQLDCYAGAIEQITKRKVAEEIIYSTTLGCEIKVG